MRVGGWRLLLAGAALMAVTSAGWGQEGLPARERTAAGGYVGFDKDDYPGNGALAALHRSFAFTGFWLNNPPGMKANPWAGKRATVREAGFGFLILFNGRLDAQLKGQDAAALGREDAAAALNTAEREGFPRGAVIFLDQEEGGTLLAEQAAYLGAWIAGLKKSGYRAGIYCSGIRVGAGAKQVSTAEDVAARWPEVKLWVWNDVCPPSPGCVVGRAPNPVKSGTPNAWVWQYARSPRSREGTESCRETYAADNGCYAPGLERSSAAWVDLDVSGSEDPSRGR
ncbi:MAG: glycoside hydrolase domain-containing protein [Acidobacteriaceae bacterium]